METQAKPTTDVCISVDEVLDVFHQAIDGKIAVTPVDTEWAAAWCGFVAFMFGDWRMTFFNDCMELDYLDTAVAPDGRVASYADWDVWPVEILSAHDAGAYARLERIIEDARLP